jgi:hypothetical protein
VLEFLTAHCDREAQSQISRREVGNCREYGNALARDPSQSNTSETARRLHYQTGVTLKIEKTLVEHGTTIKLIGRIRAEHLSELKAQVSSSVPKVVLDLGEVSLVDADAVRFLGSCESEGIQLLNCSAYIREWIVRERETPNKE